MTNQNHYFIRKTQQFYNQYPLMKHISKGLPEVTLQTPNQRESLDVSSIKPTQETQPSIKNLKIANKLNPENLNTLVFEPSLLSKILMIPFPFLMIGCCISKTTELIFNRQDQLLTIVTYPGLFRCCKNIYKINHKEILKCKMVVAYQHRINKRQAYILVLDTTIGEFELMGPSVREGILREKKLIDQLVGLCQ